MSMREAGLRVTASLGSQAHGPDRAHQELAPEGSGNVPGSVPHDPAWRPHFPARHMARAWAACLRASLVRRGDGVQLSSPRGGNLLSP